MCRMIRGIAEFVGKAPAAREQYKTANSSLTVVLVTLDICYLIDRIGWFTFCFVFISNIANGNKRYHRKHLCRISDG